MREIKFRCWCEDHYIYSDQQYEDSFFEFKDGQLRAFVIILKWASHEEPEHFESEELDEPFEQYTGFKDKNGKEIYEGDIVQNVPYDRPCDFYVIETLIPPCENLLGIQSNQRAFPEAWEVIGNIHQNPKLLEKQNET